MDPKCSSLSVFVHYTNYIIYNDVEFMSIRSMPSTRLVFFPSLLVYHIILWLYPLKSCIFSIFACASSAICIYIIMIQNLLIISELILCMCV